MTNRPRSQFEFHVAIEDAFEFADIAAADLDRFIPMARRYRAAMLRQSFLLAPVLILAGIGATSIWHAAVAAGPAGPYLGAVLGLGVAALYAASLAPLEPYLRRIQQEYRDACFDAWLFSLVGHWTVEVQQDGVEFRSQHGTTKNLWTSIHDIRLTGNGLQFDSIAGGAALIPMRAFDDAAEAETIAERARELRSQRPDLRHPELGRFLAEEAVKGGYFGYPLSGCERPTCPECGGSVAGSVLGHRFHAPSLRPQSMESAGL